MATGPIPLSQQKTGAIPRSIRSALYRALFLIAASLLAIAVFTEFARLHWVPDLLANLRVQQVIAIGIAFATSLALRPIRAVWILLALALVIHLR